MSKWAGKATTRVQCPFCLRNVAWFYRAGRFARHVGKVAGRPCAAGNYEAPVKGSTFNAKDPRFASLVMRPERRPKQEVANHE